MVYLTVIEIHDGIRVATEMHRLKGTVVGESRLLQVWLMPKAIFPNTSRYIMLEKIGCAWRAHALPKRVRSVRSAWRSRWVLVGFCIACSHTKFDCGIDVDTTMPADAIGSDYSDVDYAQESRSSEVHPR